MAHPSMHDDGVTGNFKFIIPGTPVAKEPARFTVVDGKGIVIPADQSEARAAVVEAIREQYRRQPMAGPVQVSVTFYEEPGAEGAAVDDLMKFYSEAMKGVVVAEEVQVMAYWGEKVAGGKARTEVMIQTCSLGLTSRRALSDVSRDVMSD